MTTKKLFRKETMTKRSAIEPKSHKELNSALCAKLTDWVQQRDFNQIFYFLPYRNEPDLVDAICSMKGITGGLPLIKTEDHSMGFYSWSKGEELIPNSYKIPEPNPKKAALLTPDKNTLIIVPTLAMDTHGYRMGYGGGYYDRYIEKALGVTTAGALFEQFIFDKIPTEKHDEKLNFAITNESIRSF